MSGSSNDLEWLCRDADDWTTNGSLSLRVTEQQELANLSIANGKTMAIASIRTSGT